MKTISNQILASIFLSLTIIFGGWIFYRIHNRTSFEENRIHKDQVYAIDRLAYFLSEPLSKRDLREVKNNVKMEVVDESIVAIQIFDAKGPFCSVIIDENNNVITETDANTTKYLSDFVHKSITRPIKYQGKIIGKVVVYPDLKKMNNFVEQWRIEYLQELIMLICLMTGLQFLILRKVVIKPLVLLKKWVASTNSGELISLPQQFNSIEIDSVAHSVKQMADRLVNSFEENSKNERTIKSISDNFTNGMIFRVVANEDGYRKFIHLSSSFESLYGHSAEEVIADSSLFYNRIFVEDMPKVQELEAEALRTLSTYRNEIRIIKPDGSLRTSLFVVKPTKQEDGTICWDGIEWDITELKKAQADLEYNQFLLNSILEGTTDSIYIKDLDGRYLLMNKAGAKLINKEVSEIIGKDDTALFPENLAQELKEKDRQVIESDSTISFEQYLDTPLGEVCYIDSKGSLKDAQGKVIGMFGIARDITNIKNAEKELQYNQFLLNSILEGTPDSIYIKNIEGRYLIVNNATAKLANKEVSAIIGKDDTELFPLDQARELMSKDRLIMDSDSTQTFEHHLTTVTGPTDYLDIKGPLKDAQGKIIGMFGIARDITEFKQIQNELKISQERFEMAFATSPYVIMIADLETGNIIEINDAVMDIFGYTKEEVIGKNTVELGFYKYPEDRARIFETLQRDGALKNMELVGKSKSGSDIYLLISSKHIQINGKWTFVTTVQDITERKRNEEKIRESEARYRSIISVSKTGAWEYYSHTNKLWVSPEYLEILGRSKSDYKGISDQETLQKLWIDLIHPEDKEAATNCFAEYLNKGSIGTYEIYFRMKHIDGSWVWIWDRGQTIRDHEGNVTNLTIGTHLDITERKLNELELQKLIQDKDMFMSILGHDLRDPIISIYSLVDQLYTDFNDFELVEIKDDLFLIRKSAKNTMKFLDELLQWSHIQSGRMPFHAIDINFNAVSSEVIEMRKSALDKKDIQIILNSTDDLEVLADKKMLQTILRNLLSNAIKFTHRKGTITISANKTEEGTLIAVADDGVGIADVTKIFNPSQLYTNAGTNGEKGNGLGLNMCKQFVEKHGGKIWVESKIGKGTTFYFSLPNFSIM
jgi:PAS domain S-box-containing protein